MTGDADEPERGGGPGESTDRPAGDAPGEEGGESAEGDESGGPDRTNRPGEPAEPDQPAEPDERGAPRNAETAPGESANVQAMGAWDAVVEDMEATADAYEEAGWEVHQCHPGDVTVETEGGDAVLDVLLPDDEYEAVEGLIESGVSFAEYEVLKATEGGTVYLVVVMEDPDASVALLYPGYYRPADADDVDLFETAERAGELHTHLRRLQGEFVDLVHEDPGLFLPADGGESESEDESENRGGDGE